MEAKTLNCPMCGAAARSDASRCQHCGSRLGTVACPSCFELVFVGQKFCSNCGSLAQKSFDDTRQEQPCPSCAQPLHVVRIGETKLRECQKCDGLWVDNVTFENICATREQQTLFLGMPSVRNPMAEPAANVAPVRYVKCPSCGDLMNRVNFAGCSGVIVDVCKPHGTWFDHAELRRVIDFIRAGGMDKARQREIQRLADERRRLAAQRMAGSAESGAPASSRGWAGSGGIDEIDIIAGVGRIILEFLK